LRQAYDYWQDQPGNSCNKENKLQKKTLEICALYSSLQFHKRTADQESVDELIDLSLLIDHVDQYMRTVEAKELLPTSLFDTTSYCQSFFFFPEIAMKMMNEHDFHSHLFDGRIKPQSHPERRILHLDDSRLVCDIYAHRVSIHTSLSFASAA